MKKITTTYTKDTTEDQRKEKNLIFLAGWVKF